MSTVSNFKISVPGLADGRTILWDDPLQGNPVRGKLFGGGFEAAG